MKNNQILAQRYYKFFRYSRFIALISLVLFLVVTAFNTGNSTLQIISYFLMLLLFATAFESIVLYVLYIVFKNKN